MEIHQIFDTVGGYIALAAAVGILLLLPLYLSQRRDVIRLRHWREREPEYPAKNIATNETRLDAAEQTLEELTGATEIAPPPSTPAAGMTAAARVTHERPALERITMERAALVPHPRWRRFVNRVTQPRVLIAIGIAALLLGAGAIYLTQQLLSNDQTPTSGRAQVGRVNPGDVKVAVFNGTSINGLAGLVADDVQAGGFKVIAVTNTEPGFNKTEVQYADGQKRAAQKVAGELGVKEVSPLAKSLGDEAGGADVVVIAGEDRA